MLVGYEMIIATIISYTMHDREIIVKDREQRGQSDCSICDKTLVDLLLDKIVS